jgi:uncharacterized repeat protein (TIGR03803 family)
MSKLNWGRTSFAILLLCAAAAIVAPAQTLTTIATFQGTTGYYPVGSLVQGTDGNLYGTTMYGQGCYGTVFKVTTSGTLTMLDCFDGTNGAVPYAGLVLGADGNLRGTTSQGGHGQGNLFNITNTGELTKLYEFSGFDGGVPRGWLIQATDGNFYGTTEAGGAPADRNCSNAGCGTVFKVTPEGALTTLHSFDGTDGGFPLTGLLQASNGNFYGTTDRGYGSVFELTPQGTLTTVYRFQGFTAPNGLIQTTGGDIYGTTYLGGASFCGMIYSISSAGDVNRLYSFSEQDGCNPDGALIQATDGNFYGTTLIGGSIGSGTVFRLTPDGTLTTLYSFCSQPNCADGQYPLGTLVQATDGNLYGTTQEGPIGIPGCSGVGGFDVCGTIFKLDVGLAPFVKTVPASGSVGTSVIILGTNLTGATNVKFNGTSATFSVVSSSEITATAPAGATTGEVDVETPGGKLSSNIPFTVAP